MATKMSHILKQICSWKLQVFLSMCDLLVDTSHLRVNMALLTNQIFTSLVLYISTIQPFNPNLRIAENAIIFEMFQVMARTEWWWIFTMNQLEKEHSKSKGMSQWVCPFSPLKHFSWISFKSTFLCYSE